MSLITIVVPFYNPGKYINNSINSLKTQSSDNFEVLFINDGSTDNSMDILVNSLKDCRFRYRIIDKKENTGVSATRNLGITEAKGEYILFFDADDFINENLIFEINRKLKECKIKPDIIYWGFDTVREDGKIIFKYEENFRYIHNSKSFLIDLMLENFSVWTASAVYNKEFLLKNNIKFPEGISFTEETVFIFTAFKKANHVTCIPKVLSIYYYHEGSVTFSFTFKVLDTLKGVDLLEKQFDDNLTEKNVFLNVFKPKMYFTLVNALLRYDKNNKEIEKQVMDIVTKPEIRKQIKKFKPRNFKERGGKILLVISPKLYKFAHDLLFK